MSKQLGAAYQSAGTDRFYELGDLFDERFAKLCHIACDDPVHNLTVEQAERACFQAAEELVATLRGRVRRASK